MALVLLVDVSGSVSDKEHEMQMKGLASAFADPAVQKAIWNQRRIAVTLVQWSSTIDVTIPWLLLESPADADLFAAAILTAKRPFQAGTQMGDALMGGLMTFESVPCRAERMVVDISGDGKSSGGAVDILVAMALAVERGVVVNGLPILGDPGEEDLEDWYRDHVNGFVIVAEGFEDFGRAIRQKLAQEIACATDCMTHIGSRLVR